MRLIYLFLGLLCSLPAVSDPRRVFSADAPDWLNAVGRLSVPSVRYENGDAAHYREHCTATLVSDKYILSGWHCIEYYRDLSRSIVFTLPNTVPPQQRHAWRVADGGGMDADWSLLKLENPIPASIATPVAVGSLDIKGTETLLLAGYSRDSGLGKGGEQLSYHAGCRILNNEWYRVATDCLAYKGASGGPVVIRQQIVGVVSSGDSRRLSYYTPSSSFLSALRLHLY